MFAFGFALVPLYDVFCAITGFGGKTASARGRSRRSAGSEPHGARRVPGFRGARHAVRRSSPRSATWTCTPASSTRRTSGRAISRARRSSAQAVPSVAPGPAARYFNKAECFCFTSQQFEPHEELDAEARVHGRDGAAGARRHPVALVYVFHCLELKDRVVMEHAPSHYYVPHGTRWPILGSIGLFTMMLGAALWLNAIRHGPVDRDGGLRRPARHAVRLVRHRHRRERGRALQPQGRRVVPLGDELVHLLRGHVLRRVLRHVVLRARARRAVARRRRRQLLHELPALARIREHVAVDGSRRRARRAHGRVGLAGPQHGDPAALGRHAHDRAPRAARGSPHAGHHLARRDVPARLLVPRLPGRGVHPRLHRARTCGSTRASTAARSSC